MKLIALTAAFMATSTAATAEVVGEYGAWEIHAKIDTMTDKKTCFATYKADPNVQYDNGAIFISYRGRGGFQGFYYRIGEQPVSEIQIKQVWPQSTSDALAFTKRKLLEQAISAGRLRIRALTYLGNLIDTDIDLRDVPGLTAQMNSIGC